LTCKCIEDANSATSLILTLVNPKNSRHVALMRISDWSLAIGSRIVSLEDTLPNRIARIVRSRLISEDRRAHLSVRNIEGGIICECSFLSVAQEVVVAEGTTRGACSCSLASVRLGEDVNWSDVHQVNS